MSLTREEVLHVAKLARIGMSDEDLATFSNQLSQILDHFEALNAIDTSGVPPTTHSFDLSSVIAADDPAASLTQEAVLLNAPSSQEGYLRVRAVLDE